MSETGAIPKESPLEVLLFTAPSLAVCSRAALQASDLCCLGPSSFRDLFISEP